MNDNRGSRVNKFEKRRKNTKSISILVIVGGILLIVLIGFWIFGGGDDESAEDTQTQNEEESSDFLITEDEEEQSDEEATDDESAGDSNDNESSSEEETNTNDENENIDIETVEPSDDNVSEAYTGNWEPVGTEQEGPHTTNFSDGSQDRIEIKRAASIATGINEDNMVEWWVENGGDQQVIATVSDKDETQTYRVFLSWIDNEGWQPTKVEELIENDKK